uniref:Myb-like domain-containing protein n=1 Tax=Glycine max TaxID=3847 RepID=A0A0R0EMU9_SOYBN
MMEKSNKSLAATIPSQLDSNAMYSEDAVHNGTRDWPSSFGSSGEAADIFSGLESLNDFLTQAATDTRKPALHSFNEKGAEENFVSPAFTFNEAAVLNEDDTHTSNRSETEEIVDLNPARPGDDVFHYQSMKSGEDPTSGIPVHEELTNAADSPTLADSLHADVTREKEDSNKRKKDGSTSFSLRKNIISSIAGEEDKGATRKPANSSFNEDVEDNNDLDDDYEVDNPSKKKRVSTSSQKKLVAKSGKTSRKRKKANDDLEKSEEPPKNFGYILMQKIFFFIVDKALLEIPEDELDLRQIPIKDTILLEEHRERLAVCILYSNPCVAIGGVSLHEAGAYDEEEFSCSEDGRDPYDDQANEGITSTSHLFNHQSLMKKAPRETWSKQDTQRFYEAVRTMGTAFSLLELLFPGKTPRQIKLKFNNEDGKYRSRLDDAVYNRAKDHSGDLWIEPVKLASTKAEEDPSGDASDFMMAEEVVDLTAGTNDADDKAQEDSVAVHSPEQSDDRGHDFQKWSQYKSVL